jgi:DNA-binding MarR family transcriptional regulator
MNPHELAAMPAAELASHFRHALAQENRTLVSDAFTQLEWRFQRLTATIEGSQEFLDQFFTLGASAEVRRVHVADPLVRCAARLEYLLELAGERARTVTEATILRQIVESRARGYDMIEALAAAPEAGLTAGKLAKHLRISRSNLSPLIGTFYGYGIIDRKKHGKHVFLTLTPQGRGLLKSRGKKKWRQNATETVHEIYRKAGHQVRNDVLDMPYVEKESILGVLDHALREVAKLHESSAPGPAANIRELGKCLKPPIRRAA